MPFDLMAIKAEIENMFDAEFTVQDLEYMDGKEGRANDFQRHGEMAERQSRNL